MLTIIWRLVVLWSYSVVWNETHRSNISSSNSYLLLQIVTSALTGHHYQQLVCTIGECHYAWGQQEKIAASKCINLGSHCFQYILHILAIMHVHNKKGTYNSFQPVVDIRSQGQVKNQEAILLMISQSKNLWDLL